MTEPFLKLVRHVRSGRTFLAHARKLPWKGNDMAWFRPMKLLGWKWEKVYNKKDIEVIPQPKELYSILYNKGTWE